MLVLLTVFIYVPLMPLLYPTGYEQEFENVSARQKFYDANKENVPAGAIMVIPAENYRSVRVRPLKEPEIEKRDRSGENNSSVTGGDDLRAGVNGIVNHADGKRYDSKSEFRKATRRAGCYEVGNDVKPRDIDWKTPLERGVQGDFNVRPALKDALHKHGVK